MLRAPLLILAVVITGLLLPGKPFAADPVQFNRDIRPIVADTCFVCHGPDKHSREAGLRLDLREEALRPADSGATPIVPGKPEESELVRRLFAEDESERMPPEDFPKKLTAKQKELLRRWVAEGAEYQRHWLYVPLARPPVPAVKDPSLVANPIDAFVVKNLEAKNLEAKSLVPSREADRRTLLRRLSLDLIGLPPTPEQVRAFLADDSPEAYDLQVDRLLKSPHFGERMAVWWLDVARFSDTVGFHGDQNQRIFPYRDYVIDAFNRNKPFDQFTIEQLAGDLLPNPTTEQLVATGFNRLNMMTREGGAQPKEYLAKYGADRVRTVGTTWLGSTLGCCECHDHKFDPFLANDFYSMQAFFADIKQWGVYSDYGYTPNPELKGWTNDHPFPPEIEVESAYLRRRVEDLQEQVSQLVADLGVRLRSTEQRAALEAWQTEMREWLAAHPDGFAFPPLTAEIASPAAPKKKRAKSDTAEGEAPLAETNLDSEQVIRLTAAPRKGDELRIEVDPTIRRIASIRLELIPDAEGPAAVVPRLPRQVVRLSAVIQASGGKPRAVSFYYADANLKEPRYSSTAEILGVTDGWLTSQEHAKQSHRSVWRLNPPVTLQDGERLTLTVKAEASLVPVRVAVSPLGFPPHRQQAESGLSLGEELYLASTAWDGEAYQGLIQRYRQMAEYRFGRAWTMVTAATTPYPIRVLPRGNWLDESGPVVEPAVPHFLPSPQEEGRRLTRLDLAKWLCSPENPVTARNVVNRLWKQFFGNALSNVVDDLGAQGEPPSHPELLDWLAAEFRDCGWDLKHVIKLVVLSRTYRQEASLRPELRERDPDNRWLASQNPRRLDAEFVRDNALAIAGLLNREIGGPSVKPYQPDDYYSNLQFPNRRYEADPDPQQWRRGVYVHWQRTFLHPMLANFDAPGREECTAHRVVSNTPQQALTLLNDPSFVEAARGFAQRILSGDSAKDATRLDLAFQIALARNVKPQECESLERFLAAQREHFRANPTDAEKLLRVGLAPPPAGDVVELAAWTSVARVLLNLQETITRY